MYYTDNQGNRVPISEADQRWLNDSWFHTQQLKLPTDAPRAALTYRVSTKGQVDHDGIPLQKIECRKFAQNHGWRVVAEEAEKGISGSKVSASKRDVIQKLREEAEKKTFDILLVYMFDRLGRIDSETPFVLEWFVNHGVQMWSTHEGQQRIENHADKLMNYIRFWQAAGESDKTSMRTRDRLRQIVSSGHYTGGFVPYGYRIVEKGRVNKREQAVKDLEINEDEAVWVREIFERAANEGASGYYLAKVLNERGLRTRQGAKFQANNVLRIIRHEGYTGYIITKSARSEHIPELQIVDREEQIVGEAKDEVRNYDLMSAVMICLGEETDRNYSGLLKFLEVLLSDEKTATAKKTILQNEFNVPMTQTLETEVYQMCNLSQGAIEKGIQKGIQKGYGQGREEERIASVRNLMQNLHMTAEDAMKALNIPQEDRDRIKKALAN